MRILALSPTLPWPLDSGGRLRTYHLLRRASERHEIHLWAVRQPGADGEAERALGAICSELRVFERTPMPLPRHWIAPAPESWFHSASFEQELARAYESESYDLVHLDEACLTRSVLELPRRPELLHHHKLDVNLSRALYDAGRVSLLETMRWRMLEELAAGRFDHHAFCTREDAELFLERHPGRATHVVPNGVDLEDFAPRAVERDPGELLVLGSLDYAPNVAGLETFLREVWPELRARHDRPRAARPSLVVAGRAPSAELLRGAPEGVHVIADPPDVRPYLARAAALVVPLSIGGGSRLKIAQALAMNCPVVATRAAAEGYRARAGLEVVPEIADLAAPLARGLTEGGAFHAPTGDVADLAWERQAERLEEAWRAAAHAFEAPTS